MTSWPHSCSPYGGSLLQLRANTGGMQCFNKCLRDPATYRTNLTPHQKTGDKYKVRQQLQHRKERRASLLYSSACLPTGRPC